MTTPYLIIAAVVLAPVAVLLLMAIILASFYVVVLPVRHWRHRHRQHKTRYRSDEIRLIAP